VWSVYTHHIQTTCQTSYIDNIQHDIYRQYIYTCTLDPKPQILSPTWGLGFRVHVYICMYVCMCVCMYACICVYTHIRICAYAYTHMYACMCVCMHACAYMVYMRIYTCGYMVYMRILHVRIQYIRIYTCTLNPKPQTLHPTPYTLHPTPYTLHPKP
jgi:hypothetical protein